MKIIVGLGNPGEKYKQTRHNAGFLAVEEITKKLGLVWEKNKKLKVLLAKTAEAIYVKPLTFMNESGGAVSAVLSYYRLWQKTKGFSANYLPVDLIVVHDDLDIKLGEIKISLNSRSAGHKGVQSIIDALGTKNFQRIRIGIKPPNPNNIPTEKFVLQEFTKQEMIIIKQAIQKINFNLKNN